MVTFVEASLLNDVMRRDLKEESQTLARLMPRMWRIPFTGEHAEQVSSSYSESGDSRVPYIQHGWRAESVKSQILYQVQRKKSLSQRTAH